jgi:hypothetical protein
MVSDKSLVTRPDVKWLDIRRTSFQSVASFSALRLLIISDEPPVLIRRSIDAENRSSA